MRNRKCRVCTLVTNPTAEVNTTKGKLVVCFNCLRIFEELAPEVEGGGDYEFDLRAFNRTGLSLRDYLKHVA
jgi:hypothetical protein